MKFNLSEIKFEEGGDFTVVQLLRAGTFKYYDKSELDISTDVLRNMKKNFDAKVKKVDLAVDYFHNSFGEAAGWIKDVILKNGDTELWLSVEWTPEAAEKIKSKEIRYLSADFDMDYVDNETDQRYGPTLNGAGLTNRPFVKGMNPILSEAFEGVDISKEKMDAIIRIIKEPTSKGKTQMNFADIKKEIIVLSDAEKTEIGKLIGMAPENVKLADEVKTLTATLAAKDAEIKKLSEEAGKIKKEAEFAVLMSEGKAVEAQKAAFLSGDMTEFLKLAVPVNLSEKGTGKAADPADKDKAPKTQDEAQDRVLKLSEELRKADTKLSEIDAINKVLRENPELAKLYG